jgi:hypothetical protein
MAGSDTVRRVDVAGTVGEGRSTLRAEHGFSSPVTVVQAHRKASFLFDTARPAPRAPTRGRQDAPRRPAPCTPIPSRQRLCPIARRAPPPYGDRGGSIAPARASHGAVLLARQGRDTPQVQRSSSTCPLPRRGHVGIDPAGAWVTPFRLADLAGCYKVHEPRSGGRHVATQPPVGVCSERRPAPSDQLKCSDRPPPTTKTRFRGVPDQARPSC